MGPELINTHHFYKFVGIEHAEVWNWTARDSF